MSASPQVQTILDIYAAFGRGDIPAILDQLADDVVWRAYVDPMVSWAGDFSGKARVPAFFDGIFRGVEVEGFEPLETIGQGDTVISTGWFACRGRETGKSARTRWVFVWHFRNGQVSSYEQFHDPAVEAVFS